MRVERDKRCVDVLGKKSVNGGEKFQISLNYCGLSTFICDMSELSLQVQSLKEQTLVAANIYNGTPSIFFNKSEAGHIDIDEVLEGAVSAINTLAQYDRRFPLFLENLFHPSSQYVQRELHTPEVTYIRNG